MYLYNAIIVIYDRWRCRTFRHIVCMTGHYGLIYTGGRRRYRTFRHIVCTTGHKGLIYTGSRWRYRTFRHIVCTTGRKGLIYTGGRYVISLGAGDWILGRPSECLDEGSVRTLKNEFKSTGRSLNDVLKYTVDGSDVLATRVETSVPRRGTIT